MDASNWYGNSICITIIEISLITCYELDLPKGEKPLVFITHDESTFNANDGKRQGWMRDGHQPLHSKNRGRGIMVSGFLTPGGRLCIPNTVLDSELLKNPMWIVVDGKPVRDAMWLHKYGKDNYWTGDKMIWHTLHIALPIFRYAFPNCQALFAFDNASNHCAYSPTALLASRMNLNPGGKQGKLREGFDHNRGLPQAMVFSENHPNPSLRGKAKGLEIVLRERGLWPHNNRRSDGFRFLTECSTNNNRSGCNLTLVGGCCARGLMAIQQDFQAQKGQLAEDLEAANHLVIFYPKFHCELNFIERFWCAAKWYTRENCEYSFDGLRRIVPLALASVSIASINRHYNHCIRALDAYSDGFTYGTSEFKERIYKTHRQVEDKTKW